MQKLGFFPFLVAFFQFCFFAVGIVEITKQNILWVAAGFWMLVSEFNCVNMCRFLNLKTNLLSSPFLPHFTFFWLKGFSWALGKGAQAQFFLQLQIHCQLKMKISNGFHFALWCFLLQLCLTHWHWRVKTREKLFPGETLSTGIILLKESRDEVMDQVVGAVQGSLNNSAMMNSPVML